VSNGDTYLGEGKVTMSPVAGALHAIDYPGWIGHETANPLKDAVVDCQRNGD
jgi:hypothetical protein